ncbi:MAG TPA: hypothetical protein VGM72_00355 [Micropepsaceae bacterium]|jgi:hypothetical protein
MEIVRERQTLQAIDRLRLLCPDGRDPEVYILCKIPLPGISPDRLESAKEIFAGGKKIDQALAGGIFSTNPNILAHCHPDLWDTPKAAERWLESHKSETPNLHIDTLLIAKWGFLNRLEFRVKKPGSRRWSIVEIDVAKYPDPEKIVRAALRVPAAVEIEFRGPAWDEIRKRAENPVAIQTARKPKLLVFIRAAEDAELLRRIRGRPPTQFAA